MSVFKLAMKIIGKNVPSLAVYLLIFIVITVIMVGSGGGQDDGFAQVKISLAFKAQETTPLLAGLKQELAKIAVFEELPAGTAAVLDALFFGRVSYVLEIPAGFSRAFMAGQILPLKKYSRPFERAARYADMTVEQYFRLAGLYRNNLTGLGQEELARLVAASLDRESRVQYQEGVKSVRPLAYARMYFNFMSYSLFNVLIFGICILLLTFNRQDIRLRNACGPLSLRSLNAQLFAAGLLFAFICWLLMSSVCLLLQVESLPVLNAILFLVNGLVFTAWAACVAYFLGQLANSRETISSMAAGDHPGGQFPERSFCAPGIFGGRTVEICPVFAHLLVRAGQQPDRRNNPAQPGRPPAAVHGYATRFRPGLSLPGPGHSQKKAPDGLARFSGRILSGGFKCPGLISWPR
jgi:ABC-2 type transport system permease protein